MIKTLAGCLGRYKKNAVLTPVYTCLEVIMEILIPFITASIIDKGIQAQDMHAIKYYGGITLVMAFFSLFFGIQAGRHGATASTGLAANLRESMYANIQTFAFSNIDSFSTAGLVTRMTTDVTNIQNAFQMLLRIAVKSPLMLVFSMIMCFFINKSLSLVFFAALIILGVVLFSVMITTNPIFQEVFNKYDNLNASVQENVSAIRTVKAFVREDYEEEKYSRASGTVYRLFVKAESRLAVNNPIMMFCVYGCVIAISWFAAHFIAAGTMTTGSLTSLFTYVMIMMMSLMMLSMVFVMITMSAASARRIVQVLNEESSMKNPAEPADKVRNGDIDFDHVYFSYRQGSGEYVLSDIDIHIRSGETIGIIGGTGSGKTSLVSLISRLYDVDSGSVRVGGIDVRDYDMESLRKDVSVVLQKNVLFSGTILDNLRWGREDASEEECIEACRLACADEFIERLPEGYNTWIEQGGTNVSGGQRQRLCIARALMQDPKVLILDDSTSAVDTATNARINRAFAETIPGTTKLIVSQRISSIENADRILVLDEGRISGFDTSEKLLETNAIYREIYEIQMEGGGDFDEHKDGHGKEA